MKKPKEAEIEVDGEVHQEESVRIQKSEKKVPHVRSHKGYRRGK